MRHGLDPHSWLTNFQCPSMDPEVRAEVQAVSQARMDCLTRINPNDDAAEQAIDRCNKIAMGVAR